MTTTDLFGAYVRDRLDAWGREFALHRDCDYLGHQSKNMLQALIDHRGEMPPRPTGFKPLEFNPVTLQIEDLVAEIARRDVQRACCMRAYYCGTGRRGVERLEVAQTLIQGATGQRFLIGKRHYFTQVELGTSEVRGFLAGLAQAA
jgi:hypothetical protein